MTWCGEGFGRTSIKAAEPVGAAYFLGRGGESCLHPKKQKEYCLA